MQIYLHMVRQFWIKKIKKMWDERSVVWLTGVRRSGKTTLCKELTPGAYFDCELPSVRKKLQDPEQFFSDLDETFCTLDEIHRLENAAEVLKIAADHFPHIKVIATGSSSLSAGRKFQDTLTGRKREVFLSLMNTNDLVDFREEDLVHRILHGGLPPFFLAKKFPESDMKEWVDSFWSKDIQEIFSIEKKGPFLKFFELLALQSGGMFEAKSFSATCGVSHTTIAHYLQVMAMTHIVFVLRPFHKNQAKEIISAPKVYFFDTGFIHYFLGQTQFNEATKGLLFEHIVLNEMLSFVDREEIHYWRDKARHEIDFIVKRRGQDPIAIECKWQAGDFNTKNLEHFRKTHPKGLNILVATDIKKSRIKNVNGFEMILSPLHELHKHLE